MISWQTMSPHPYYPLDLELPDYVPNLLGFDYILGVFFASVAVVFGLTWLVSGANSSLLLAQARLWDTKFSYKSRIYALAQAQKSTCPPVTALWLAGSL